MIKLPTSLRGRRSSAQQAQYEAELREFCRLLQEIRSTLDFEVSARGWAYLLESHGLAKGDFDKAQRLVTECRKRGLLPLHFTAEDGSRAATGIRHVDDEEPEEYARKWLSYALNSARSYDPFDFWDFQPCYVQLAVEKIDLKSLFEPVCRDYHVPLINLKGWADLHSRAAIMRRAAEYEAKGKRPVLLYCGDFDPGGLSISETLRDNFAELAGAVGWDPSGLEIRRFGLNFDFIEGNALSWIPNLETSSGGRLDDPKHKDHRKPYVQDYLRQYGARKCEANALVVRPEAGRELCREAIRMYIDFDGVERWRQAVEDARDECQAAMPRLLAEAVDGVDN